MFVPRGFIGVAVGSGCEGVDLALIDVHGLGLNLAARITHTLRMPIPRELAERCERIHRGDAGSWADLAHVHRGLPEVAAGGVLQLLQQARTDWSQILALGWLGPLLWHDPNAAGGGLSLETGMAAILAERTGLTTISDFRARDLSVGGLGQPISTISDWLLCRSNEEERILVHLGAKVTIVHLPRSGRVSEVTAFEAGPCNRWLDGLIHHWTAGRERYDAGGRHAVQGRCLPAVLERWCRHPFFAQRPPRSLGRTEFAGEFLIQAGEQARTHSGSLQDLLCTATHLVARSTGQAIRDWLPPADESRHIYLSGGGVRNGMLWQLLAEELAPWPIDRLDALGVSVRSRSSAAAGLLATLALDGVPANSPTWTGATGGRMLGHITPGSARNWSKCIAAIHQQTADLLPLRDAA